MSQVTTLSQGVTLHVERDGVPHEDDAAWVEMPFGPTAVVDIKLVEKELREHSLALIDPSEEEPEVISVSALRVWCYFSPNE